MLASKILTSKEKFHISLGLQRIARALELLGNPQKEIDFIHAAGTNGKGSVCAILEAILCADGRFKIGKYTSPHLFSYTERFCTDGVCISQNELDELTSFVDDLDKKNKIGLSEFEILTVVCFLYFKKKGVQIGILETGLGGRLDATNIIKKPIVSIITSISLDHKERLGGTIEKIAAEKAGIFKKDCPCIFLKNNSGYKTLLELANQKKCTLLPENIEVEIENGFAKVFYQNSMKKFRFNLAGDFQAENLKLALLALYALPFKIPDDKIALALEKVKWKFRMEHVKYKNCDLLIDGSHNPDGARVLAEYLDKYHKGKKIKFIFGCLAHKDWRGILNYIYKPSYDFCFYEFDYPNALKYKDLGEYKNKMRKIIDPLSEIKDADLYVFSGSLYMLGRIFNGINLN